MKTRPPRRARVCLTLVGCLFFVPCLIADDVIDGQSSAASSSPSKSLSVASTEFLQQYCVDCHGDDGGEADLNLADLTFDPSDHSNLRRWVMIYDRVSLGEMPPIDESRPDTSQQDQFLSAIAEPMTQSLQAEFRHLGRVRSRRLNRVEYENTIHDLLGVDLPLQGFLPEDTYHDGFATVAEAQQVSHHLLGKYLDAADASLDAAFGRALKKEDAGFSHTYTSQELGRRIGQRDPWHVGDETIAWSSTQVYHGRIPETEVKKTGRYRITLHDARAFNTEPGEGIWCTVRTGVGYARVPIMYLAGTFRADQTPRDQSFEAWIPQGFLVEARPSDHTIKRVQGTKLNNYRGSKRDKRPLPKAPGLAYSAITMELIHQETKKTIVQRLFGDKRPGKNASRGEVERLMQRFASRAFRRPVSMQELAPYMMLVDQDLQSGLDAHEALKRGYRSVLCSPRFLFLNERAGKLDDYAIAARLSYFLWSTMPDAQLLASAQAGELRNTKMLHRQVDRMLADSRVSGLVTALADQWLNLREIDFTSPDPVLYPEFDETLQQSMIDETHAFLAKLIDEDLPASNIIDSDFAMLNERLAKHYGIADVHDQEIRPVMLSPDDHRGGLLTQGAVLKVTANGTTTSPVVRGAFINERLLGVTIPPPPDNIPAIEPDIRGAISIRDQLEKHSNDTSCAACHIKIDPPGFALENYDVIGGWRTNYRNSKKAKKRLPVDPHHQMASGETFEDIDQFKQIVLKRPDQIAGNFTHQLITYATGGPVAFSDRTVVQEMLNQTEAQQYGVRSLIHAVIDSSLFLNK